MPKKRKDTRYRYTQDVHKRHGKDVMIDYTSKTKGGRHEASDSEGSFTVPAKKSSKSKTPVKKFSKGKSSKKKKKYDPWAKAGKATKEQMSTLKGGAKPVKKKGIEIKTK